MIIYHRTSLLDSSAQTVVNTVNCVGVMGKGLAAAFKKRHPAMFQSYKKICDQNLLETGKLWLWKGTDQWVLNFPTKEHWRYPSKLEWIEAGLKKFVDHYDQQGIREIAFPKLGCGNGNLDWNDVRPVMERYLDPLPITVFVHDYEVNLGLPEHISAMVSDSLKQPVPVSFDAVWEEIGSVPRRLTGPMIDFEDRTEFDVETAENSVCLRSKEQTSIFEQEELSDAWRILSSGILTKRKLGLSSKSDASKLISLLSLLPSVRPVQIQSPRAGNAEIAAEIWFKSTPENSPKGDDQLSLAWR